MSSQIAKSKSKVDELNELKKKEAALLKQIKIDEQKAQNDIKIVDALERAEKSLDAAIEKHNEYLTAVKVYSQKLLKASSEVTFTKCTKVLEEHVYCYIINDKSNSERYDIETLTKIVDDVKIEYKGRTIFIKEHTTGAAWQRSSEFKMQYSNERGHIPYDRTNRFNKHVKTVLKNIDAEVNERASEIAQKIAKKSSHELALDYFTKLNPNQEVKQNKLWRQGYGRKNPGYTANTIDIEFKNGSKVSYRIYPSSDSPRGFTVSLNSYEDSTINNVKNDHVKFMRYLSGDQS